MIYHLLAYLTILLHLLWILFLALGILVALKRPRVALVHVAGLLFSLVLNIFGWYCPLTYLENYLRRLYDAPSTYSGPFTATYLERIVYPDLPETYIRLGEIIFVVLYGGLYVYLARKYDLVARIKGGSGARSDTGG